MDADCQSATGEVHIAIAGSVGSASEAVAADSSAPRGFAQKVAARRLLAVSVGTFVAIACCVCFFVGVADDGDAGSVGDGAPVEAISAVRSRLLEETPSGDVVQWYGSDKVADASFWTGMRGIGFSPSDPRGPWFMSRSDPQLDRLDDALTKVVENGYNMIRTWRTGTYEELMLARINDRSLDIKVQLGVEIDEDWQARSATDEAFRVASQYPHLILGFSVGNERMHFGGLNADQVREHARYAKETYGVPVTYNFVVKTITHSRRRSKAANVLQLVEELDYVNVHLYGGHYLSGRYNRDWTPRAQVDAVRQQEAEMVAKIGNTKPFIIGETGWQSRMFSCSSVYNLRNYYALITRHVYSDASRAASMFFFNLNDEAWKGRDDSWGLYDQGDQHMIGDPNTQGKPKFHMTNVTQIVASTDLPNSDCCASTDTWPDLKHGTSCGGCKALVKTAGHNRCDHYCESFGHQCVGAAEEVENDCEVLYRARCDEEIQGTSDMLCACRRPECAETP